MKKIIIRADSNEKIAGGHIMRTKSIAAALKEQGTEVVFVTADEKSKPLLDDFKNIVLGTKYDEMDAELGKFSQIIAEIKPDFILIDSYFVTKNYLATLKKLVKTAYINDVMKFPYEVDLLINYSAFLNQENYKNWQVLAGDFLLGSAFAPLRAEFSKNPKAKITNIKKVLITTGNSDNLGFMPSFLSLLDNELKKLEFFAISGLFNTHKNELKKLENENIKVLENVENMSQIMRECDIAISAGGSTLYELAALSLPTICFKIAENQNSAAFWGKEAMIYAGDAAADISAVISNAKTALKELIKNPSKANELAAKAHEITDGKGAKRIAAEILAL